MTYKEEVENIIEKFESLSSKQAGLVSLMLIIDELQSVLVDIEDWRDHDLIENRIEQLVRLRDIYLKY